MSVVKSYTSKNLILRIIIGFAIGALLGFLASLGNDQDLIGTNTVLSGIYTAIDVILYVLGNIFVGALRAIAPVLVFFLVSTSLMKSLKNRGKTIRSQLILYAFGTFFAAITAVVINNIAHVEIVLPQDVDTSSIDTSIGLREVIVNLFTSIVSNPIAAIAESNYLGILFWAILFGIAARTFANKGFKEGFDIISNTITKIVSGIIECAPFGIAGLVYCAVAESGISIFTDYGMILLVYLLCIALIAFVLNPLLVFVTMRRNPYPLLFQTIKKSAITAFFFRSSAANIPFNMALCEELDLDKENYSISIPLGSTINMEGAAITIITLTLSCCFTLGIQVDFVTMVILSVIATLSAAGTSGVSGGSILLVPMGCSLFGITGDVAAAVVSIGFIIGVVQDSFETALNSSSDVLFTAAVQFREKIKAGLPVSVVAGGTVELKNAKKNKASKQNQSIEHEKANISKPENKE